MDRDSSQRQRSVARELRVETEGDWTSTQPSPRRVATAPSSPSTAYTTDREATFRSGNATVSETHVIRSSGSQSQSYTEEHWSSEITSFVATAPPKFIQVIKAYRILSSDTPTLVVEVASEPPAIFEWFCNDKPVMQDKRRFQTRHGLNITTLTINKPEQGVYKCTARNPAGCSTSYGYITVNFEHRYEDWNIQEKSTSSTTDVMQRSITYHHAPRFTSQVPNLTVPPGSEAVIDVEVDADPPARFSWFVNGREFRDSGDNVELFYPKDNRCVARFSIPVSGQYKVVASNLHGSAMSSGYVEIYQANPTRQARPPMPPGEHMARSMMTSSQQAGHMTGTETAAVTSTQTMSVYEVNYAQRSSSVPRGVRHLEKHVEVATAAPPETKFMSASARNSRSEPFEMVAPDLPEESAPKIIQPLHSMAFMDGQPMVLRCQIKAIPSAAVEWTKDDVNVEEWVINKDVTTQIHPDGVCELVNPECFPEDSGLYKCLASNPYGTAETSAFISVEPPEYKKDKEEASMSESFASELHPTVGGQEIILPPKFVEPLLAEVDGIEQLDYIRLVCRVVSAGPVIIVWRKDDQLLDNTDKYEFFEFEDGTQILTIYRVTSADNGVYTCSAESDHGLATTSTEVSITRERKESPLDVEIVDMPTIEAPVSPTQIEITVQKPPKTPTDEVAGVTEIRKNEEEFKLLVKVADSVASTLVANVFVDAVREAARRIIEEESSEEEELEAETGAPRFDTSVEEYVATEGSPTKISISVSGYPTPFVEWYFGENKLKVTENLSMSYEKGVASLNLRNVQFDHAGTYYLQATNPHGTTVLSTKLKVVPKQSEMNIRTSLAKYDKAEADEKVVTNVFAHQPEPEQQQEIKVMVKRSDSQTFSTTAKEEEKTKEEEFEMVKKEESSTPPDFEVVQMEEAAPPAEQKDEVKREEPITTDKIQQQEIPVIVETVIEEVKEQQHVPEAPQQESVPKIIVPEEVPVPAPRTKKLEAQAAEQEEQQQVQEKVEEQQPVKKEPEIDQAVKEAAEKFAESFTEKVLSQAQDVVLTAKAKEETKETQVIKTLTTVVLDKEEESGRRSVTMPYEETIKNIENRLEAAASPELSTADAVNMVMETVMSLKKDRIFEQDLTVDVRNPDGRFDHVVTVVEPEVLQLNSRISAMVPQLKFIDMDTILQRPGTSQQADCLLPSLSRKNANAEHRVIVLEGASQNFHDAMKWSLRKVQQLAEDEQTTNANVEVVRPPQTSSEVTAVVEAERIIPDLLQVAAAANKLKLENVTVSLVKRGDSSHTQLVIEYESQVEDEVDVNESRLEYDRPTENKEEMWSRRSRFSEEDERVAAVFVEVDAVCPDQNVEIIATVNMPLETTAEQTPIAVESLEHSLSVTETSGALQPPKFFRQLVDSQAVVGHPVQFKCIVSGTPTPQIIWSVDGDVIEPNHEYNIVYEDGVSILKINDVVSEDEGEYWCEAVNAAGRASTKCFLKVLNAGWPSGPIDSTSDPDSTDIFEWEERRIQELIDRENALLASLQRSTISNEAEPEPSPCSYNEDLKEISAFHKYFETAETAVLVTELYELGTVEGTVKAAPIRGRLERLSSTSTTEAEFYNKKKNSFCVAATRLEKQNSKEKASMEGLWDSEFNNPFGSQSEVKADDTQMYEPRTPLLPVKMSYKGQKIDVSVNEVEKEEKVVNEQGEVEISKKTCLETSLEFNSPLNNPKKISTKKPPVVPGVATGTEIVHQIDELKAETNALMSAMRRAEQELKQLEALRLTDATTLGDDIDEPSNMSMNTSEAELIDLLRKSQTESLSKSVEPTKEIILPAKKLEKMEEPNPKAPEPKAASPPVVPQKDIETEEPKKISAPTISVEITPKEEKRASISPPKASGNFLNTMKEIERIARSVEHELAELSHSSGNEMSDDAKSIEEAILMMSDRLVMQHPLTEAQAEATEELLRTTLADMILNPTRSVEEEIEIMKKPIRLLRRRISEIENSLMEDAEVQQLAEAPTNAEPGQKLKRVPSAELIRMTPLTSNIKDQLTVLEDMINEHMESEATESYKVEPVLASQKRKDLHNIFMQINEEINTIRMYCSKKLTKKGADAVMSVLHKVRTHVTSIVNVMNLAKKKKLKNSAPEVTENLSFVKNDPYLQVDGVMVYKQKSMETSSLTQTQRSSAAISTASDDTWKFSKNERSSRSTRASSENKEENVETITETAEHTPVPIEVVEEPKVEETMEEPPQPPPRRRRTTSADPRLEKTPEEEPPVPPPRVKKQQAEKTEETEQSPKHVEEETPILHPGPVTEKAATLERKNFFMRKTSSEKTPKVTPDAPSKPKRSFAEGALGLFKNFKNPLKKKKKDTEEYEPLVNEGLDNERNVLQFKDESNLLDELRLLSRDNRGTSIERHQSPIYDEVARSVSADRMRHYMPPGVTETCVDDYDEELDLQEQMPQEIATNVVPLVPPHQSKLPDKWSEEEIHTSYAATHGVDFFATEGSARHALITMQLPQVYSADYSVGLDDTNSVQMVCEESDYATDTDTSCMLRGSVHVFRSSPLIPQAPPIAKIMEESFEGEIQEVMVNVELTSVDIDDAQDEAQFSFAEMLVYESDLDSEAISEKPKSETQTSETRSDKTAINPIEEAQISEMFSSSQTVEEQEIPVLRETDILSDESLRTETESNVTAYFDFTKVPSRRKIIAQVSQEVFQSATVSIAENLFEVIIEQEPENLGLIIKITEDLVDYTSLTVFSAQDDEISDAHPYYLDPNTDFTETSSFDEYEGDDTRTGINVSIIARSLHDSIYASLEEIPWGEVAMNLKENDMCKSVDTSLQFNVTVSENADERKSLRSQPSLKESQNSIAESNTLSNTSINIPSYVIKLGSTATITCELNNYLAPNSRIDWVKGKKLVVKTIGKFDRISHDLLEVLIINNVDYSDNELYSLRVNNDVFPVAFLLVEDSTEDLPTILTPPQTQFVMEGQPTEIPVQVTKGGQEVVWFKDKKPLANSMRHTISFSENFSKVIFSETRTSDQGTYVAMLGEQTITITLVVEERIDEKEVMVVASGTESEDDDIQEYLVPPGSTATIACELEESDNRRSLIWIRDGRPLMFNQSHKLEHVVNGLKHYLVIHDTGISDSGLYSVSISGTEFRVAHLVVNDLATSIQSHRRKRISNVSLNK